MDNTKQCPECGEVENLLPDGYCKSCTDKLEKQKETGRCAWCGRLVMDCVCDDEW